MWLTECSRCWSSAGWEPMGNDLTEAIRRRPDDEAGWDAWFREIYPQVLYITARRSGGDIALAEEATQGAMERFLRYRAYERVDSDRSAVAYLARTAIRLLTDDRRRHERESPLPEEVVAGREGRTREMEDDFRTLLAYVSPEDRRVLEMVLAGHSVREIAEALGVGYSAAGMRIHRAKNRLRDRVGEV